MKKDYFASENQNEAELVKNCETIEKFVEVKYKYGDIEMAMAINNLENLRINVTGILEDTVSRVYIFIRVSFSKRLLWLRCPIEGCLGRS